MRVHRVGDGGPGAARDVRPTKSAPVAVLLLPRMRPSRLKRLGIGSGARTPRPRWGRDRQAWGSPRRASDLCAWAQRHGVSVVVVVVGGVVVVVVQAAQQVLLVPTVPPAVWQLSAEEAMLHAVPQSLSALQLTLGSLVQVPLDVSQVPCGVWQV